MTDPESAESNRQPPGHASGFPAGWEVPAFRTQEIRSKQSRYCVCVFVINEGPRLHAQLARMQPLADQIDIIIADGGSSDGSVEADQVSRFGVNTVLVKTGPGKLSAQMRMGLAFALQRGYEGIVCIDGNNKDDPAAMPEFIRRLDAGVDHLQGSRFRPGGQAINTPKARYYGVRLLHAPLISLAAGRTYSDTTNGFRAYSRRFLLDPRLQPFRDVFSGYELHYYLAIQAGKLGYRTEETPVTRAYPATGKVPTKIRGWRGNLLILKTLALACLGAFDLPRTRFPEKT